MPITFPYIYIYTHRSPPEKKTLLIISPVHYITSGLSINHILVENSLFPPRCVVVSPFRLPLPHPYILSVVRVYTIFRQPKNKYHSIWVCLKIVYPIVPNGFADHYPY